uniref:Uncharacterized protein n=1 Tax=Zeugodacus cucurbitae TaxID=28588 RepID=A0A0A1XRW3_ZEUCU
MPERYAWLTLVCVLCVLKVGWCRAADDDEHVHIKVRMPEVARKHKSHKPSQQHSHHKYHHLHHQYYHNLHKPYHQQQLHAQYPNQAAKQGRRAVRPTPLNPPMMSYNHQEMGVYGDELTGNGMSEHLLHSPTAAQPIPIDLAPNYGPALFGSSGEGSKNENIRQQSKPASSSMLTMPGGSQQLVQQMELMGALAAAAAAAAGGASVEEEDANSGGGGVSETNTLLADDFLADLQSTYANGKYPAASLRRKKKYRGPGLAEIGDAAVTFALNSPQHQQQSVQLHQQQLHLQLMREQYQQQQQQRQRQKHQQQFYGGNYFMQQAKPQAQMLRATPVISNNNNNYHNYHQHMHYKNKQHYNNNDIYTTATSDEDNDTDADEVEDTNEDGEGGIDDHHDADDDNFDDEVSLFFSRRPTFTSASSPATTPHNSANDYDDDVQQQFGYNGHMNSYFDDVEGDANVGVNPVSYQPTTAYGAYAVLPSTPATATQHKVRPYRQLQQQKHRYSTTQSFGISGHQQLQPQQQHITTAQPINVVGPTASDFDDQQTPPTQPQPQQQHHKYPVSPRYKKRKNRIKAKLNRNRILTQ